MPGTYTKLLYHVVFGTKGRAQSIAADHRPRLHEYLGGIVRAEKGSALEIGGTADHVHMLIRWRADEALSTLLRNVKGNSSRWLHETIPAMAGFRWQEGYSAFTVSESQRETVAAYIREQERHHRVRAFEEELVELLKAHGVDYDPRYVVD